MRQGWFFYFLPCLDSFGQGVRDVHQGAFHKDFWCSIGVTFGLTVLLLALACRIVPRSWQDKPISSRSLPAKGEQGPQLVARGPRGKSRRLPQTDAEARHLFWLAARLISTSYVWMAVGLAGVTRAFTS